METTVVGGSNVDKYFTYQSDGTNTKITEQTSVTFSPSVQVNSLI